MTRPACPNPIPVATLLEHWLGELDEAREEQIDEHLLGCGHCSANLQSVVDIGSEIRTAIGTGAVHAVLSDAFVKRLSAHGLRLREYRVAHNGSVHCTVAPEDDLLITRLDASLGGIDRLDLELLGAEAQTLERMRDVPFDAASGEVVVASRMQAIRALPASTVRMRLLAISPGGERLVGEYSFNHTPWHEGNRG